MSFVLLLLGCGYDGPPCDAVDYGDVTADTTSGVPVLSWDGAHPNYLTIFEGDVSDDVVTSFDYYGADATEAWALECECHDKTGEIGCRDGMDRDFRACVPSPVEYGVVGDVVNLHEDAPALELVSGQVYSAVLGTFCHGEREQDDDVNGGDPWHVNHVESVVPFVAP